MKHMILGLRSIELTTTGLFRSFEQERDILLEQYQGTKISVFEPGFVFSAVSYDGKEAISQLKKNLSKIKLIGDISVSKSILGYALLVQLDARLSREQVELLERYLETDFASTVQALPTEFEPKIIVLRLMDSSKIYYESAYHIRDNQWINYDWMNTHFHNRLQ